MEKAEKDSKNKLLEFSISPLGGVIGALSFLALIQADGWLYGWVQALTVNWREALDWLRPFIASVPGAKIGAGDMEVLTIYAICFLLF